MATNEANLRAVLASATEKALTRAAIQVVNEAKRLCPVDTGTLRRSITFHIEGIAGQARARVGSNLEYALWVENGTGIYGPHNTPIVPVVAKRLVFTPRGGSTVFARSVRGRPATPFLAPALSALRRAG